ncbi:phage holin family protein [Agromyces sp. NPDC058484]|uniref:phage holin family protein n=1 Tax=Agromyces sp. NPDC058484 TaxID=3346524 RepID=UPI003669DBC1
MVRFLIRIAISLVTAALGLLVASWILTDFHIEWGGFLVAIVVFAIAQAVLAPFIFNVARKYASAILGGIGLVSTFVALLIASLFPSGIRIEGVVTWVLATLIVWIVTALGAWLLPLVFLKERAEKGRSARRA